jgi:hypothetical protein
METISSKRGSEASGQHLKLWNDFEDTNHTISFLQHKVKGQPEGHLEFPIKDFISPLGIHNDKRCIQMKFYRMPKPPKPKHKSRGSLDLIRRSSFAPMASLASKLTYRRCSTSSTQPIDESVIAGKVQSSRNIWTLRNTYIGQTLPPLSSQNLSHQQTPQVTLGTLRLLRWAQLFCP